MRLAELSIRRPIFIVCIFLVTLTLGILSYRELPVELYPNVNFPVVNVLIPFPGAGPEEIENQISKPFENALSGIPGIRMIRSSSLQGAGVITTVFSMDTDMRFAEQKVNQTLARIRGDFPSGIREPSVRTIDPSDVSLFTVSVTADIPAGQLFDLVDQEIRPLFEQIPQVGWIESRGGRKREIQVELNRIQLARHEMSVGEVVERIGRAGMNIPIGQFSNSNTDTVIRSIGQFNSIETMKKIPIRFVGNESTTTLEDVGTIQDGLTDEKNRVYINGRPALTLDIYRQGGSNTLDMSKSIREQIEKINSNFKSRIKGFDLSVAHDGTRSILDAVKDATLSIEIGALLTICVVFLFLGSVRSTLITGIALPNSLLGAFLLMRMAGFTVNITTLAALSLSVGLLIDDAIVVRESIFRRIEKGEPPKEAAVNGTQDVLLAVVATTLTVLSVFGPVSFLKGIIGQFFKEFGLTICFAMLISLLDSLTLAPMLSTYFAGKPHQEVSKSGSSNRGFFKKILNSFDRFQEWQERVYLQALHVSIRHSYSVLGIAALIFGFSFVAFNHVPKAFLPPAGAGEFLVSLDSQPGTSLIAMDSLARQIDQKIRNHPEVKQTLVTVGSERGENNLAKMIVQLQDGKHRSHSTDEMKDRIREDLKGFSQVTTSVRDIIDIGGGAGQPYAVNFSGQNIQDLKEVSNQLIQAMKQSGNLRDIDSTYRAGAPEIQVVIDPLKTEDLGVSSVEMGGELRLSISGAVPAQFHAQGNQYDIRVRLREDQRDLGKDFNQFLVPNLNHRMLPVSSIARKIESKSPSTIQRENRKRVIQVTGDVNPKGRGLSHALQETRDLFSSGKISLPAGVTYEFAGQTRDFQDLLSNATLAVGLSVGFMFLVLASLYESFFIPLAIMLVLPLAICGAFYALALAGAPLEINSMIGCILLFGVAAKNSILLVDRIQEEIRNGMDLNSAILAAGKVRLRPIMMTSFALIAGMLPVAIPLEESAQQRAGMAIAVIGGVITSTLLTLLVIPAAYGYIEAFEAWVKQKMRKIISSPTSF